MRTIGDDLVLVGGRPRGTLYAVYRFLEDVVGVRWWSPFEEFTPRRPNLEIAALDRQGKPRFNYRDICQLYADDDGRFAARNRINGRAFGPSGAKYGTGVYYGPPNGVHTFYLYLPPQEYFDKHPEWFSLIDGKRTAERAQLCLTNPQVLALVIEKLKGYIEQARADARRAGRLPPVDFDISQNDCLGMCQCPKCQAIATREGSQSGLLLYFLNQVADAIRDKYPDVRINTLAYQMTEDPPKTIRPRENIIPRLCDTNANMLRPITHPDNRPFAERLAAWSRICRTLRIWDYAVTYSDYHGLPLPTVHTYPIDYRFFAEHNIEGVFTEHEYPVLADMRDLKVWMMMKLLEDPYRDYDALLARFHRRFLRPGGPDDPPLPGRPAGGRRSHQQQRQLVSGPLAVPLSHAGFSPQSPGGVRRGGESRGRRPRVAAARAPRPPAGRPGMPRALLQADAGMDCTGAAGRRPCP